MLNSSSRPTLFPLMSFLHCKKYQYGVFLLPGVLRGFTEASSSVTSPSRCRRSWMCGLLFLNDLLEDMSAEREPKFSLSSGTEGEPRGSASPRGAADRETELRVRPRGCCQRAGVRGLDDRCCEKSSVAVRFRVLGEILPADRMDNLAKGAEILFPLRTHEHAKDVNIFNRYL